MSLTKEQVCVFIENEAQLQKARELLNKYNQLIDDDLFYLHSTEATLNYLQIVDNNYGWWLALNRKANGEILTNITLTELEEILKQSLSSPVPEWCDVSQKWLNISMGEKKGF